MPVKSTAFYKTYEDALDDPKADDAAISKAIITILKIIATK